MSRLEHSCIKINKGTGAADKMLKRIGIRIETIDIDEYRHRIFLGGDKRRNG